jgi:hypothetical protein
VSIIDEAKARVTAQNAELARLEDDVARLASTHSGPVLMAIMRALVEMVCAAQGPIFRVHNKLKLYQGVLAMLRAKGIS